MFKRFLKKIGFLSSNRIALRNISYEVLNSVNSIRGESFSLKNFRLEYSENSDSNKKKCPVQSIKGLKFC